MEGRAQTWFESGSFFEWTPPDAAGSSGPLHIFHAEFGDPSAPPMLLVHGFPTSSADWFDVVDALADEYRVCLLDFPGFGFSDKPQDHRYALERDRELLEHYASRVLGIDSAVVVAHDRGDSVALALADHWSSGESPIELRHLVLTNANVFLPLSNLTTFQRLVLNDETAPQVLAVLTAEQLAAGMGLSTFTPPRSPDDPAIQSLVHTFAYNDGIAVLHDTIHYLFERAENELAWLTSLAASSLPTTLVWGLYDTVSPFRVAAHVWDHHLASKPGANEFWLLPRANHYLQHDQPDELVAVVTSALAGRSPDAPGPLSAADGAPILLDHSRNELPASASILSAPVSLDDLAAPAPADQS
jgi:pimeloyl-ACP methyl ester carboxylesterase